MAIPKPNTISETDYVVLDEHSQILFEYADGQIYAMSGALRVHNRVNSNIHIFLSAQVLGDKCEIYQSDMRVQVQTAGVYRYPDVVVACGEFEFREDDVERTLQNPILLAEILSPTTENINQIQKRNEYKQIPSLQEYLIVFTRQTRIERYLRQNDTPGCIRSITDWIRS